MASLKGSTFVASLFLTCILAACSGVAANQDPKPIWHMQFSTSFNESTKLLWFTWETEGKLLYDALQQVEVVHRANGRGDRYCLSVHPRIDTPCTHLVVDSNRYLIFPELKECCKCCTSTGGCGILDPRWLEAAEYTGQTLVQGKLANGWTIRGLQPNNYYATAEVPVGVPLELDQLPNDYITFQPDTFKLGPVDPEELIVPDNCAARCPLTSVCTLLQLRASFLDVKQRFAAQHSAWAQGGRKGLGSDKVVQPPHAQY